MQLRRVLLVIVLLLCCVSFAQGGEAQIQRTFEITADVSKVVEWAKSSRARIASSTDTKIVSQNGNTLRLRKSTAKGVFEFTVRETIQETPDVVKYYLNFVTSHQGNLTQYDLVVIVTRIFSGSRVYVQSRAAVNDSRVRNLDVRVSLLSSVKGFERVLRGL